MSAASSPNAVQATQTAQAMPSPYHAEYNVLSGRWMVLDANNVCYQAGLSEHKARAIIQDLTQTTH